MSKEIKHDAVQGSIRHDNHVATAGLTLRPLNPPVNYILIKNRSSSAPASVSFDGVNSFTIDPKESLSIEGSGLTQYYTGGGVSLEVLLAGDR